MKPSIPNDVLTNADKAGPVSARAEFRVFGHGIIEPLKERMWNGRSILQQARSMPTETYVLSRRMPSMNVKVRDGLLDIKVMTARTEDGYEVFEPRGKFKFPLAAAELNALMSALRVDAPEEVLGPEGLTLDAFLEASRDHPDLAVVTVQKARWGFTMDGVICEYAHVFVNGALLESACVESEDLTAMRTVVSDLGLEGRPNVNYPKALASVLGIRPVSWPLR